MVEEQLGQRDATERDAEVLWRSLGPLPEPVARPVFLAVSGLPGTGKSHLCRRLAERLPLVTVETDALRRALFLGPTYSQEESARLFNATHRLLEGLLRGGYPVVLDATNLIEGHRELLYHIALRTDTPILMIRVEAPAEVVAQRLERRAQRQDSQDRSDADWRVYQRMLRSAQAIRGSHFAVDTSRDVEPALTKIVRAARRAMRAVG